ncbi:MAG: hypothetical protein Q4E76_06345 [Tissierellia bacterium]|nr:hypothetical protein [Tissierellia bacterium]
MKQIRNFIWLLILFSVAIPTAHGFWEGSHGPSSAKIHPHSLQIGQWYRGADSFKPGDSTDVTPGEDYIPGKPYTPGDVIMGPDGSLHEILVDIPQNTVLDFNRPNPDWTKPMEWTDDTPDYRWFHHYDRGDYVWYRGELYKYVYGIRHNPNTETQKSPGDTVTLKRWEEAPDAPADMWIRTKVYMAGDVVSYSQNGRAPFRKYIAIKDYTSGDRPSNVQNSWRYTGEVVQQQAAPEEELLELEKMEEILGLKELAREPEAAALREKFLQGKMDLKEYLEKLQALQDEIQKEEPHSLEEEVQGGAQEEESAKEEPPAEEESQEEAPTPAPEEEKTEEGQTPPEDTDPEAEDSPTQAEPPEEVAPTEEPPAPEDRESLGEKPQTTETEKQSLP